MIGIYKITNPNGEIYIGKSKDIDKRWAYYRSLKNSIAQPKLHASFLQYGVKSHKFEVIHTCNASKLTEMERLFIDEFMCYDLGLNTSTAFRIAL